MHSGFLFCSKKRIKKGVQGKRCLNNAPTKAVFDCRAIEFADQVKLHGLFT